MAISLTTACALSLTTTKTSCCRFGGQTSGCRNSRTTGRCAGEPARSSHGKTARGCKSTRSITCTTATPSCRSATSTTCPRQPTLAALTSAPDGAGGIGGLQAMTSNTALGPASLAYYLYRYYDPNLQRWPNRDPLGESGGINLFQFNGNNPLRYIDSDGFIIVVAQNLPCSFYTNLNNAINRLWNSPTGSNLLQRALNSTNIIYITQAPDSVLSCEDGDPGDPTNTIYLNNYPDLINPNGPILDPDQFPPASEMPPYDSTGGSIVLAHELGHTIVGPDDFQNILLFENPVRSDLGLLPRTNCHGKPIPNPQ